MMSEAEGIRQQSPGGAVGICNLPIQKQRRVSRDGVNFTIIVVGESGSGKTTLINTLFATTLLGHKRLSEAKNFDRTVRVEVVRVEVEERGFPLRLTLVDTPGFGDYVNNSDSWNPIIQFIDSRFNDYLQNETTPRVEATEDLRVHVCLYFIQPTGRTLKNLDMRVMKELSSRVNLIPIISKADTLTRRETIAFKERIKECLIYHKINTYTPSPLSDDESELIDVENIIASMPLAVIGSENMYDVGGGKHVYGRGYRWGTAEVENPEHSDFKKLRTLLMKSHMFDLITTTEDIHYENYRFKKYIDMGRTDDETESVAAKNLDDVIKEEEELCQRFTERVKLEENRFKQWEQMLKSKREDLNKDLQQQHSRIKVLEEETSRLTQMIRR